MTAGEVAMVVVMTVAAMLGGACLVLVVILARTLSALRRAIAEFECDSGKLLDELRASARHAAAQVDRVDRLVAAAETVEGHLDTASRLAQRTFQNPVVKVLAVREGVRGASQRLRTGDSGGRRRTRRRKVS